MRILCTLSFYIVILVSASSAFTAIKIIHGPNNGNPEGHNNPTNIIDQLCKECFWMADSIIKNVNTTFVVEYLCTRVEQLKPNCGDLVTNIAPKIHEYLQKVPPEMFCRYLDLCSNNTTTMLNPTERLVEIISSKLDCLKGEVFWCSTYVTARKCGKMEYCADTLWK